MRKAINAGCYDSDKSQTPYLRIYEEYFEHLFDKEVKLLELGVASGGSLLLWRDYFGKGTIVGLDMEFVRIEDPTGRIRVYQGYQQDIGLLDRIASEQAPEGFDVIIDDCSHVGELTRTSFWHLFENHLKPGGIYAIEDFHTGYMDDWPDGRRFGLAEGQRFIWLRLRIIPSMRWILNTTIYRVLPHRLSLWLQRRLILFGTPLERVIYNKIIPSHMYGMVGFVKELVDACCLGDSIEAEWGGGPRRYSMVGRLHISKNLAIVVKSSRD